MITPTLLDVAAITGLWPIGDDYHSASAAANPISIPTDNISFSRFIKDHCVDCAEVITQLAPQVVSPVAHSSKDKPVVIEDDDDDDEDDNVSLADKLKSRKRKPKPAASASQKRAKGVGASTTSGASKLASDAQPEVDGKEGGGDASIQADVHEHSISNPPSRENAPAPKPAKSKAEGETQGATSPIREAETLPGKDDTPMPPPKSSATMQPSPQAKGGSSSHVSSEKLDTLFEEDPLAALDGFLDGTLNLDSPPHQADATAETAQSSGVANFQQVEESMGRLKAIVFASGFLDQAKAIHDGSGNLHGL
ncbi:uncharacterized protein LOC130744208 [Lotus japonicus]|uniref:uncharacterized protein LOC130744208 n=1 Tax=Lotus japonicus TaxID=34305 RepID=UPI002590BA84|nr:uncharacterized protein LOC130744208 [Lotus japonicus]